MAHRLKTRRGKKLYALRKQTPEPAPAAHELRRREVLAIHDAFETVAEEKRAHVVEVRFAAIDEFAVIAGTLQHLCQRGEVLLCLRQLHDAQRWRRRKASDDSFDAAHRARASRIQLGDRNYLEGRFTAADMLMTMVAL